MQFIIWLKKLSIFILLFFIIDFSLSAILLEGLNKYFGLNSKDETILLNGSSMFLAGFNKAEIATATNKNVALHCRNGVALLDRKTMLEHYFNTSKQKTAISVLEVNPLLFSNRFTAENVYLLFLPFMDDESMSEFVKSKTSYKDFLLYKFIKTSRYNGDLITVAIRGYLGSYENKKNQILDPVALSGLKKKVNTESVEFNLKKVEIFKEIVTLVQKNSNKIILVNMPIFETKMQTFKKEEYQVFISFIQKLASEQKKILFLDLNQKNITSNPALFSDPLHLNSQGQKVATDTLIKFINSN